MSDLRGRSVRLFLVDGIASGILTAEIMNWTGHVFASPRTRLEVALTRSELKRTGVYFLIGPDDEGSDIPKVYVGESDDIAKRIYQHNRDDQKEFWERFVAVTSKDMNLTKAHVKYLEGRILDQIIEAKKASIENRDNPSFDRLPEADIADMESFLREMELVLPVIGVDFLRKPNKQAGSIRNKLVNSGPATSVPSLNSDAVFVLENTKAGIRATASEIDGEFVVFEGSIGSLKEKVSFNEKLKNLRDDAFLTGRADLKSDNNFVLTEDIAFSSPSAASVFLFGTSRNGRTDWALSGTNMTYGAWKDSLISPV